MYGIIIASAILICLFIGERLISKKNLSIDSYWSAMFWTLICGLVGARLFHVIDFHEYYLANPIKILYVNQGGLGILGGVFGGALGLYFSLRAKGELKKNDYLVWLDVVSVVVPLGQGIGRWGNFFNQELFGLPTNFPWGIYIPPHKRPEMYINNDYYHPLFLYESLLDILLFLVLLRLFKARGASAGKGTKQASLRDKNGFFTYTYLVGYGLIRFCLEYMRINSWKINGINVAQAISLFFVGFGISMLFQLHKKSS